MPIIMLEINVDTLSVMGWLPFPIRNSVRQGALLSPILFNLYTSELFDILDRAGHGNRINDFYMELFGYADDLALSSNTVAGLKEMLNIPAEYAEKHNITFSTNINVTQSKTKSIVFGAEKNSEIPNNLMLNGKPLPWVESVK